MDVRHPLMVVGTADKQITIFNLQNPQCARTLLEMRRVAWLAAGCAHEERSAQDTICGLLFFSQGAILL